MAGKREAVIRVIAPGVMHARIGNLGMGGDPDQVMAWVMRQLEPEPADGDAYEVRFLPHGADAGEGETVEPLAGHHGVYSRLAVKR